jgi:hypothetical protein
MRAENGEGHGVRLSGVKGIREVGVEAEAGVGVGCDIVLLRLSGCGMASDNST